MRASKRTPKAVRPPEATEPLTQLEFTPADFTIAERVAVHLGYTQYPYTSTSALWGLFCLPENPEYYRPTPRPADLKFPPFVHGCVIKTRELGILFVQSLEDLRLDDKGRSNR
jgi:hypothetical protein